ncbi:uncharacterized protein [Parasteatoda tepidariorum]|uniref:uncharacterized protein n=1 Tax=Parasteatoda tepidariorum TaxID=114398 RepID=UPI001C71DD2C|nr:uncharacterized protein LOC107446098 [Parasteatoda tepidariorum]
MFSVIFPLGLITSFFLLALSSLETNTRRHAGKYNYVMAESSELREIDQLEESANTMFSEYWQMYLLNDPEKATELGDHRYDDKLTSYSLKSYEKRKVMLSEFLERGNQMLPRAPEGSMVQNNLQLFVTSLQSKLDELMSGNYLFPVSNLWYPEMAMRYMLEYMKPEVTKQYWNIIMRYRALGTQIDEQIELMREGIRTNFTSSNYSLPSTRRNFKNEKLENSAFYQPFLNITSAVPSDEALEIQRNASDAVQNFLIPALEKLEDFIQNEYRPSSRSAIGVSALPNGNEFYRQRLSYYLADSNVTAQKIHDMGVAEVSRITLEMDKVIQTLGFNYTRKEFNEYLRNNKAQHFNSGDEALQTYRNMLENTIPRKLSEIFKHIPRTKLQIQAVPEDLTGGPLAYYIPVAPDNSTPGIFFLDTSNLPSLLRYDVTTLSLHEGIPGHHFQFAYAMEQGMKDIPDFRKHGIEADAYTEGWGLYAEHLGYELGLLGDPYQHFGHLSYEMFRACRLVVDTGIHVMGWTRDQAINYMADRIALSLNNIGKEVDRYITWPGQACAYKYGEIKIKELRKKAEDALGNKFDVREFHDVILRNKAPFAILEKEINRYILATKNSV